GYASGQTGPSNGLIISGNVGIGTTSPLEKLDVSGNATVSGNLTLAGGARTIAGRSMNSLTLGDASTGNLQFYSSSNYLNSSGNLVLAGTSVTASSATVTASTFSGSGASLTSIPETAITDGSLLARVGSTETIAGAWTFSAEPMLSGSGRHTRAITLSPEYAGAVLTAFYGASTDTAITGSMTSDASPSAALMRTHYSWTSTTTTPLQSYTVAVRVTLPEDFDDWTTSNAVQIDYNTLALEAANNDLNIYIYNSAGTSVYSSTGNVVGTLDGWTTKSLAKTDVSTNWNATTKTAVIYLRLQAMNNYHTLIGDIKLNYLSKW
ncbi:hypothetical protein COU94_03010, partial [Candidatus Shapirobacteria bacterium CG10_big_fil_rev_8_21_14_0_10_38_8]